MDIFSAHAMNDPQGLAVVVGSAAFDRCQWVKVVNKASNLFRGMDVDQGDRAMIVSGNSWEMLACSAGLQNVGCIAVPVNPTLTFSELSLMIADIHPRLILAGESSMPSVVRARAHSGDASIRVLSLDGTDPGSFRTLFEDAPDSSSPLATGGYMLFTSGTSGRSKAAFHAASSDNSLVSHYIEAFRLKSDDVHLVAGPLYHSAPSAFCSLTLSFGGTVVVMQKFDPALALQLIETHRVTTTFMAPILLKRILDLPQAQREKFDLRSLRAVIMAGSHCPFELKVSATEILGDVLYEFYGSTETKAVTFLPPEQQLARPGSCGRPMPGVEVELRDEEGREVSTGEKGEVWVRRSSDTFRGYWGDPQKTDETIRDGWIRTGDLAVQDVDGYLYIVGRKSALVISGGVNIYPAEIEAALLAHPQVLDAHVIGLEDEEWGERLHALVVARNEIMAVELETFLRERLAAYKVPRSWEFVEDLKRGDDGKLRKGLIWRRDSERGQPT